MRTIGWEASIHGRYPVVLNERVETLFLLQRAMVRVPASNRCRHAFQEMQPMRIAYAMDATEIARRRQGKVRLTERLLQIRQEILDVFNPHGETDEIVGDA